MKKLFKFIIMNSMILFTIFSFSTGNTLAAMTKQEIDIASSPEKILFDIHNFKPGDWSNRTLTIHNNGNREFKYITSVKYLDGSEKYFNELLIKISDRNKVLYEGKLKNLNKLSPRILAKNTSEQLIFQVSVPWELGNEFQGIGCRVEFIFYAEDSGSGTVPTNGGLLPTTATNIFNFIAAGGALIVTGIMMQLYFSKRKRKAEQNYVNLD